MHVKEEEKHEGLLAFASSVCSLQNGVCCVRRLTRKSKISVLVIAAAISFLCSVLRLFSSE